ncbi:MAG TPA: glycosyltransferase family 2 protein [Anaerolineales bacterium]
MHPETLPDAARPKPLVSIVVPCYNEANTIGFLLNALYSQSYPREGMEVVIADGMSTDRSQEQVSVFQQTHPELPIRVVQNQKRIIPAGLNQAIRAAQGEVIVRLDGHAMPAPDYVLRCVAALEQGRGENVGGVWQIEPARPGWVAQSIAAAAAHPLGVGDALYRYADRAQAVDTVPFGAFYRSLVERIGPFDETLLTNEDYEFNTRVRLSGGRVWLDPAIRSKYLARASLAALARQYARYGYWKMRMLRRYPSTIRWRQALPPAFVFSLVILALLAILVPLARWLLTAEIVLYALALLAAGVQVAVKKRKGALAIGVPLAIATMHLAWGGAFLWSLIRK